MFDDSRQPDEGPEATPVRARPDELARLGVVLGQLPQDTPLRWVGAMLRECAARGRLRGRVAIDRCGVSEALEAIDADGVLLFRLLRLPDSDFLAWEQALACVPVLHGRLPPTAAVARATACQRVLRIAPAGDGQPEARCHDHCSHATWRALQRMVAVS
jgi:hypothetical protein